ncbi:uncharacterized protein SCHCODRAFT_02538099 [Schizophyllum commune H4-8]|nr:uncharacterized protein SCHCODRAFT_02538099 [Schizophyllum commune H4-8]KAI5893281.1 hypothetical protein SCHCODRAFT_02538099 [Schizophyllum commune H4-8]
MSSDPRQRAHPQALGSRTSNSLGALPGPRRPAPVRGHSSAGELTSQSTISNAAAPWLVSHRPEHQVAPYAHSSFDRNPLRLPHFGELVRGIQNVSVEDGPRDQYADARQLPPLRTLTSSPAAYAAPSRVTQPAYGGNYASRREASTSPYLSRPGLPTPPVERGSPAQVFSPETPWESQSVSSEQSYGSGSSDGIDSPTDGRNWEDYAQRHTPRNGPVSYSCIWRGDDGMCEYNGKKQLVKRHVENVHLKIRRHVCPICQRTFAQRTGLDMHVSGHTGENPLKCRYEGCPEAFRDPARRHRHYCSVHGHQPRSMRRNQQNALSESASYESIQPWSSDDGRH